MSYPPAPGLDNAVSPCLLLWTDVECSTTAPVRKILYPAPLVMRKTPLVLKTTALVMKTTALVIKTQHW